MILIGIGAFGQTGGHDQGTWKPSLSLEALHAWSLVLHVRAMVPSAGSENRRLTIDWTRLKLPNTLGRLLAATSFR